MMEVATALRFVLATGYLLLAIRLVYKFFGAPVFSMYLLAMAVDVAWGPLTIRSALYIEPALACLRVCMVVEAFWLVTQRLPRREFRMLMLLLAGIGLAVSLVAYGFYGGATAEALYRTVRQHLHLLLTGFLLAGIGCYTIAPYDVTAPLKRHYLILTAYFMVFAVASFVTPEAVCHCQKTDLVAYKTAWLQIRIAVRGAHLVCIGLWLYVSALSSTSRRRDTSAWARFASNA